MRNLINCTPRFSDIFLIDKEFDKLFDYFSKGSSDLTTGEVSWSPTADIIEEDNKYLIKAELPGVKNEDIKVSLDENILTLSGSRKHENESKDKKSHVIERSYGTFSRSFRLPKEIKQDEINASYKDGILELNLPKAEKAQPKQIEIKIS